MRNEDDFSEQVVLDIKWHLFADKDDIDNCPMKNEIGFEHGLTFVKWDGNGHSFIVSDGSAQYRIAVSKVHKE